MENIRNGMRKSSRKELTLEKIKEEKEKERERSYNHRSSTSDSIIGPTLPPQLKHRNGINREWYLTTRVKVAEYDNGHTNFRIHPHCFNIFEIY